MSGDAQAKKGRSAPPKVEGSDNSARLKHYKKLKRLYNRARLHSILRSRRYATIEEQDPRHATFGVGSLTAHDIATPMHVFLLNRSLLSAVKAAMAKKGSPLTENELLDIALSNNEGAVQDDFSPGAIAAAVASYYASPVAFSVESQIANMYAVNITLNYVIGSLLAAESGHKAVMRVKELASSTKLDHWQFIVEGMRHQGAKHIQAVLTDFVPHQLDPRLAAYTDLGVGHEVYNVMDDLTQLPERERFNAFIATYTFDSIWQPEDMRLTRVGNQWYLSSYRLKVADWNPRRYELVAALREGRPLERARAQDYQGIFVEETRHKVDLSGHPYKDVIDQYPGKVVNVPGGAIKRIRNAFDTQLHDDGIFVIGEVMQVREEAQSNPSQIAGLAARFKVEDYRLLKQILEKYHGMRVDFVTFPELADRFLPDGWRLQVPPIEREQMRGEHGNCLVVVRRDKS